MVLSWLALDPLCGSSLPPLALVSGLCALGRALVPGCSLYSLHVHSQCSLWKVPAQSHLSSSCSVQAHMVSVITHQGGLILQEEENGLCL